MALLKTVRHAIRRSLPLPPPRPPVDFDLDLDLWSGPLQVRLARDPWETRAAQALRYRVFYQEMSARPTFTMRAGRRDFDPYDDIADHLLVLDHSAGARRPRIVGTYRLIRRAAAARIGGFYTAGEFDISRLEAHPGEILELGRSCVEETHRTRGTLQLLWRGIAAYVDHHDIEIMFGCASLPGRDITSLRYSLGYLAAHHTAPEVLRPVALPHLYQSMRTPEAELSDPKRLLGGLPPLIKGYLRLGGWVGDGAVIDQQFGTTDVCVVVRTDAVTSRYIKHYERANPGLRQ